MTSTLATPATVTMLDRQSLTAVAMRYLELLRDVDADYRRDIPAMLAMLHDDIDYQIPFLEKPAQWKGKAALTAFLESMQGCFKDLRYDVEHVTVDVDAQSIVIEMTSSRTVMPQGMPYQNRYAIRMTIQGGLIALLYEYVNPLPAAELSRRLKLI